MSDDDPTKIKEQKEQRSLCPVCHEFDLVRILGCKRCGVGCAAAQLHPQANDAGSLVAEVIALRSHVEELEKTLNAYRSYAVGSGVFVHEREGKKPVFSQRWRDHKADLQHIQHSEKPQNSE